MRLDRLLAVFALCATSACGGAGPLARWTPKASPHESYAASLRSASLDRAAMGKAWLAAADGALASPAAVTLPLSETGYLDPAKPAAVGYRFELPRGRRLAVELRFETSQPSRMFIDLFRVVESGAERVASAEDGAMALQYVSRSTGAYVLRLQPELLGGGRYTVTQRTEGSLRFPVEGAGERDIQSLFGDARDGGRRDHHGVDIFAPRGTAALAAANGTISSVNTTEIGGRVVWLHDATHGQSIYYAHLDDWAVRDGQQVSAGDVVGYVGNTGNARTTPPHLHFGIYSRGPVDPLPFIRAHDPSPRAPSGSLALVGGWGRVVRGPAALHAGADRGTAVATLPAGTAVLVRAATTSLFRVALPDGREGFVEAAAVGGDKTPFRVARAGRSAAVRERPSADGIVIRYLDAGARVPVIGEFNGFMLVELADGGRGWLQREAS